MTWILTNSLWLVGLGLMLASSGIDGAYMARWMPEGWEWLGYVLNTTADVSGMVLTYFFGRLQQDKTKAKRRLSLFILAAELIAVAYSWFFSWRQLLIVLPVVEPYEYRTIAPWAAGFIPLLLAFIGYAESLLAGRFDSIDTAVKSASVSVVQNETKSKPIEKPVVKMKSIDISQWRVLVSKMNGDKPMDADGVNQWLEDHGYEKRPISTAHRWAKECYV